jgi:hypothetical protein
VWFYGWLAKRGELGGNRTHDPRIKSALLYRLSYELEQVPLYPNYHNFLLLNAPAEDAVGIHLAYA